MKDIHRGNVLVKADGTRIPLNELRYIFSCPRCEYRWSATEEIEVKGVRDQHNVSAHPDAHLEAIYEDSKKVVDAEFSEMARKVLGGGTSF